MSHTSCGNSFTTRFNITKSTAILLCVSVTHILTRICSDFHRECSHVLSSCDILLDQAADAVEHQHAAGTARVKCHGPHRRDQAEQAENRGKHHLHTTAAPDKAATMEQNVHRANGLSYSTPMLCCPTTTWQTLTANWPTILAMPGVVLTVPTSRSHPYRKPSPTL